MMTASDEWQARELCHFNEPVFWRDNTSGFLYLMRRLRLQDSGCLARYIYKNQLATADEEQRYLFAREIQEAVGVK